VHYGIHCVMVQEGGHSTGCLVEVAGTHSALTGYDDESNVVSFGGICVHCFRVQRGGVSSYYVTRQAMML